MTSHITVSAQTSGTASTGLSSTKPAGKNPFGAFGAILDSLQSGGTATAAQTASADGTAAAKTGFTASTATSSGSDSTTPSILDLLERLLHLNQPAAQTPSDPTTTQPDTTTAALAATATTDAATAATATDAGTPPTLLKNVVAALKAIDKAQQSGEPVSDDLLKQAKKAIDALATYLAGQPAVQTSDTPASAASDPDVAAAGAADTKSGQAAAARLATARASLTALTDKLDSLAQSAGKLDSDLSAKLETLAKSLDPKTLSAQTISALGLDSADAPADPALASAINGLVNGKAQASAALQPALGTPQLKLPDALGGLDKASAEKPAAGTNSAASASTSPSQTAAPQPVASKDTTADRRDDGSKSSDDQARSAAAAATAATDKPADASSASTPSSAAAAVTAAPAATARLAQATYQAAAPAAINLPQMAYEIVRHVQQGESHFQIRLDPADLGRVDVKLAIDQTGTVNAHLTVERTDTLDLLRRDAAQLNQALSQAGVDAGKTNLQFSLSQNPFTRQDNGTQGDGSNPAFSDDDSADSVTPAVAASTVYRGSVAASGLNLFV